MKKLLWLASLTAVLLIAGLTFWMYQQNTRITSLESRVEKVAPMPKVQQVLLDEKNLNQRQPGGTYDFPILVPSRGSLNIESNENARMYNLSPDENRQKNGATSKFSVSAGNYTFQIFPTTENTTLKVLFTPN